MSRGLDLVRRLARVREQVARRELGEAVAAVTAMESRIRALADERARQGAALSRTVPAGAAGEAVAERYRYLNALEVKAAEAESARLERQAHADAAEGAWLSTRQAVKGLDRVAARRRAEAERCRERRLQQELDDLARPEIVPADGGEGE